MHNTGGMSDDTETALYTSVMSEFHRERICARVMRTTISGMSGETETALYVCDMSDTAEIAFG